MKSNPKYKHNQWRAFWALVKASLLSTLRNPSSAIFGLVFPLVFIVVFGLLGNNSPSYKIAFAEGSDTDNPIYRVLSEMETVKVETESTEKIEQKLSKGDIAAVINIKEEAVHRSVSYQVELKTSTANPQGGEVITSIVEAISDKLNLQFAAINDPTIKISSTEVTGRKYNTIDFVLPGQLGFALLSTGVFATAFIFINLKATLVIKRIFATPTNPILIVLSEGLARLIFALFQASIIIGIGALAFNFTLANGLSTFVAMLLLSGLGLIVFLGFGFIISSLAKSAEAAPPLANIVTLPQFLLSGAFFPIDNFPDWLQTISRLLPLTYFNDAMRKIAFEGASLQDILPQLAALLIWGVIIYVVAIRMFKWD